VSRHDWTESSRIVIADPSFTALIMAAMRRADSKSLPALRLAFPKQWQELQERDSAPVGLLLTDACPDCGNQIVDCAQPGAPVTSTAIGPHGQYCLRLLHSTLPDEPA